MIKGLNNKGFAITTVLFGVMLLFLMLMLSLLGILSVYRKNLQKIIESSNGVRDVVTIKADRSYETITYNQYINDVINGNITYKSGLYCFKNNDCRYINSYDFLNES